MVSVIICTRNRSELLMKCIRSLEEDLKNNPTCEIIVVDNASTDQTKSNVLEYAKSNTSLIYIYEGRIGVSYARNTGAKNAKHDCLLYLDDDGLSNSNLFSRTLQVYNEYNFSCWGGRYIPYHRNKKPNWMSDDYGSYPLLSETICEMPEGYYASGGIMAIRKQILDQVGYFDTKLGMMGSRVAYGEEPDLQKRIKSKGFKVGFDPNLKILHLVAEYKYSLTWQLKSKYAIGKTANISDNYFINIFIFFKSFARILINYLIRLPKLLQKNYYFQNYLIDNLGDCFILFGKFFGR